MMSKVLLNLCDTCARHISLASGLPFYNSRLALCSINFSSNSRPQTQQKPLAIIQPSSLPFKNIPKNCEFLHYLDKRRIPLLSQTRGYKLSWLSSGDNGLSKVVSEAEKIVGYPTSFLNLRCLFSDELSNIAFHIRKLVGTKHPLLKTARGLVFDGKHNLQMRGLLVMLISKAAGPTPTAEMASQEMVSGVYLSQRSLAEITEVIHTANLIHKGVVNLSDTHPDDGPLPDLEFGNKMAVLSGDYLLASACTGLAKLENPTVLEKIATSIGDMMTAEFTRFSDASGRPKMPETCQGFSDWLRQTHLSVGSLMARSCQSAMILAGHSDIFQSQAFSYGENVTYAQELCRDLLPFLKRDEISTLRVTSAPVYMYKETASEEDFNRLQQLMMAGPHRYHEVVSMVTASGVVQQCKDLCLQYRNRAIQSLDCYDESDAKVALINMATVVSDVRV